MTITVSGTDITFSDGTTMSTAPLGGQLGNTSENAMIFGGTTTTAVDTGCSILNTINSQGVTSQDTTMSNTTRKAHAGGKFGNGNGYYFGGYNWGTLYMFGNYYTTITGNGVFSSDSMSVGGAKGYHGVVNYGVTKSVSAYGYNGSVSLNTANYVESTGVIAGDVTVAGSAKSGNGMAGFSYGGDKGSFAGAYTYNLVTNTGVIAADASLSGLGYTTAAATYGYDKGYIYNNGTKYTVSNTGVFTSTSLSSFAVRGTCGSTYGGDKAVFFGGSDGNSTTYNKQLLISNTGVATLLSTSVASTREYAAATSVA